MILENNETDLEVVDEEILNTIEIINFTDEKDIDSIYNEQPYYLEPEKVAQKAYALLRDTLRTSGKVGVTIVIFRNKEGLAILNPYENVIVLNRIRFNQEIREASELLLPPVSENKTIEMDMADKLVKQLTEKFDIEKFNVTYATKLLEMNINRSSGIQITKPLMKVQHEQRENLVEMHKVSLERMKNKTA